MKTDGSNVDFALLPLDKISPSPTNPRRTFDEAKLKQLGESIATKGVIEPIIVRKQNIGVVPGKISGKEGWLHELLDQAGKPVALRDELYTTRQSAEMALPLYEIVAGERRWRASALAGKPTIPALIRVLSDLEAAEIQVIENDQREDVPPLEQAAGYRRLISLGECVETIAVKIGRPVAYVVNRLKLLELVPELNYEVQHGKLPLAHAYLLAKLTPEQQAYFVEEDFNHLYDYDQHPLPIDELRRTIRMEMMQPLDQTPWKLTDAKLLPEAGACSNCPKRTGANPTLFDDLHDSTAKKKPDSCLDLACYGRKKTAFVELSIDKAKKKLPEGQEEPVKIQLGYGNKGEILGQGSYKILTAKEAEEAKPGTVKVAVLVAESNWGEPGLKLGAVVQIKLLPKPRSGGGGAMNGGDWEKHQQRAKAHREAYSDAAEKAVAAVAEAEAAERAFAMNTTLGDESLVTSFSTVTLMLKSILVKNSHAIVDPIKRRGHKGKPLEWLKSASCAALFGLLCEMEAGGVARGWSWQKPKVDEFWEVFGVDVKPLWAAAEKQIKAAIAGEKGEAKKAKKVGKKAVAA